MSESTINIPDYLSQLNDGQREAAMYGTELGDAGGPLLIIAGAGTGKTSTLAHRVAHLLAHGADPERLLLLTFSRRAADEMTRRVQRIASRVSPRHARLVSGGFPWAGTFHSVGARLLRDYAGRIGIDPAYTIHDREDSADLMNLARHELGLSNQGKRFPLKGTCLAIYSAAINTQGDLAEVLQNSFPWCCEWEAPLKSLFLAYVEAKQAQSGYRYNGIGMVSHSDELKRWNMIFAMIYLTKNSQGLGDDVPLGTRALTKGQFKPRKLETRGRPRQMTIQGEKISVQRRKPSSGVLFRPGQML